MCSWDVARGVATVVDIGIYTPLPKSAQVNFLWGKMAPERLLNSFIHPQKLLYPPKQISGYAPGRGAAHFVAVF